MRYPRVLAGAPLCSDAPFEDRAHTHPFIMQLGSTYERGSGLALTLGARAGPAFVPAYLQPRYGDAHARSLAVFGTL